MEKEKNVIFEAFARKAAERIEERKKLRTMRLMVKSVGMEVEIRGLTEEEIRDCMDFSDESIEVDKYTIYMASPTLQNAAKILVEEGTLKQHYKITEMFTGSERTFIVNKVLELSGMTGDAKIEVIREDEEIKKLLKQSRKMWLAGYWMERGYRPEEIFAMPRMEQGIMQAIAELNREQCKEDMRDAFLEALSILLPGK